MVEGPIANGGLPIRGARGRGGRSLGSIRLEEGDYLEGQAERKWLKDTHPRRNRVEANPLAAFFLSISCVFYQVIVTAPIFFFFLQEITKLCNDFSTSFFFSF